MASSWTIVLVAVFFCTLANCFSLIDARQLPDLYWNSSNPLFPSDPDGGVLTLTAEIMDTLTIHCPFYNDSTLSEQTEQAIIYRVTKAGFDKCRLDDETSQPVAMCTDPFNVVTIPLVFRQFTPVPSGLEYRPGQTYYFISTSDGSKDGLNFRLGGLCFEQNLRIQVVIEGDEEAIDNDNENDNDGDVVEETEPKQGAAEDKDGDDEDEDEDYDAPLSPKFRRPSSFLRMNQGYVFPTNSLDPFLGPFSSDADATTPSYWNNFIRKAFSGQVGQERFTTAPPSRRESLGNDNLEDSRDETPMTYSVFNAPSDTGKRRGLRAKNGDEAESQKSSDLEARESLSGNDSDAHDPGYEIHEVHDLPSTSYRSSSSKGTSSFGLLLLFNSLIAAIRWLL